MHDLPVRYHLHPFLTFPPFLPTPPLLPGPTPTASSAAVAYTSVCSLPLLSGVGYAAAVVLCGLSAALSLFCAYNVLAGGNPPPKAGGKGGAKAA